MYLFEYPHSYTRIAGRKTTTKIKKGEKSAMILKLKTEVESVNTICKDKLKNCTLSNNILFKNFEMTVFMLSQAKCTSNFVT